MKNKIVLATAVQLFMIFGSCSSNSESVPATSPLEEGTIKADYIAHDISVDDFVVNNDNSIFIVGQGQIGDQGVIKLEKIDENGTVKISEKINNIDFFSNILSTTTTGDLLILSYTNYNDSDNIYHFENNYTELKPFYAMKPISSPFASKIRLTAICNNQDKTYFVYDYNNAQIKRVLPELNSDTFVAGTGKKEITDGIGMLASFANVSKIISLNKELYVIDEVYDSSVGIAKNSTVRKLSYANNEWTVKTLLSTTNGDRYQDIAFDANNNLYLVVSGKGIYKLNLLDNTLSVYKDGDLKISSKDLIMDGSFKQVTAVKFKDKDIYLKTSHEVIKLSNYQEKFDAANK